MIPRAARWAQGRSELGVALFLLVLGVLAGYDALRLEPALGQRDPIGPRAAPLVVGALLVVVAVLLALDVLRGGRGEPETGEDVDATGRSDWRALLLLSAAFLANVVLIERAGWPISGALLYFGCAYALGSRHYVRDPLVGLALGVGSWYLFVLGLGVSLPVGVLKGIL